MNNTNIGNKTEHTISSVFRKKGYWVYNCPKSSTGSQPVDLIAIKGKTNTDTCIVWLVDGKHVRSNEISFKLERIEPNQWISMKYASEFACINIENIGFAIEFERSGMFYYLPYKKALELDKNGEKSIKLYELATLEDKLNEYDN